MHLGQAVQTNNKNCKVIFVVFDFKTLVIFMYNK